VSTGGTESGEQGRAENFGVERRGKRYEISKSGVPCRPVIVAEKPMNSAGEQVVHDKHFAIF